MNDLTLPTYHTPGELWEPALYACNKEVQAVMTTDTMTRTVSNSNPVNSFAFRQAISKFTTGIAIVSCFDSESGELHGATVSSLTSISLEPPTVMISLKSGRSHSLISREGSYGISILSKTQRSYALHFAGQSQPGVTPNFSVKQRIPTLADCLARFECKVVRTVQIHDHTLFFGEIVACDCVESEDPLTVFSSEIS